MYFTTNNKGIISYRNIAINQAKGDWIVLLDSDDFFNPNKLEELYSCIKKKNFDVICNAERILDKNQRKNTVWFYGNKSKNFYLDLIKFGNCISTSASTINREFILNAKIRFNEEREIRNVADYDFFLNIAKAGGKFYFLNKPLGFHRFHDESTTQKNLDTFISAVKKVIKNHFLQNSFNREILDFSLINIQIIEILSDPNKNIIKKIFHILQILISYPKTSLLCIMRIINKKIKNIFLNIYTKERI